ncbi:MAG TPA: hypothetical protein VFA50_00930 [Stellaceae bacterium]|nr:hypothetical protein [Stellaceae bacterium]
MRPSLLFAVAAVLFLFASPSFAAGDATMGRILAEHWCISCHAQTRSETAQDSVPSLRSVAQRPGRTADMLRSWLTVPHGQMPNLSLTRGEIDDLVAYLITLQSR